MAKELNRHDMELTLLRLNKELVLESLEDPPNVLGVFLERGGTYENVIQVHKDKCIDPVTQNSITRSWKTAGALVRPKGRSVGGTCEHKAEKQE